MSTSWTMTANKGDGKGTVKAPPGNHVAVLVGLFDMGHQWQDGYKGAAGRWQHRAYFVWELVGEEVAGTKGKNHVIGIDLTLSMNEKAKLRKWVESRTGKAIPDGSPFDPTTELGQPCMLNVVMNGDYPKIEGMAAVPKGVPVPKPTYEPLAISLGEFQAGAEIPEWCPWLFGSPVADHIKACQEIGEDKPTPKKRQENGGSGAPKDDGPPPDDLESDPRPDPAARWDFHNGKVWEMDKATKDVEAHIAFNKLSSGQVWVRPAGKPQEAKRAHEYHFADGSPIPY